MEKKIRLGIIGVGNMGTGHIKNIEAGKCPEIELAAVADINPDLQQPFLLHYCNCSVLNSYKRGIKWHQILDRAESRG